MFIKSIVLDVTLPGQRMQLWWGVGGGGGRASGHYLPSVNYKEDHSFKLNYKIYFINCNVFNFTSWPKLEPTVLCFSLKVKLEQWTSNNDNWKGLTNLLISQIGMTALLIYLISNPKGTVFQTQINVTWTVKVLQFNG